MWYYNKISMQNIKNTNSKYYFKKEFYYILLIILLFFTNLFSVIWFTRFYSIEDKYSKEFPFIEFSRNFIAQEHYLANLQPLREDLNALVSKEETRGNEISLYFEYLNTGGNISINQDKRIFPASLNKVPVALAVLRKVEKGEWNIHNELLLTSEDIDNRFGDLYKNPVDSRYSIEFLLKQLLEKSDNTSVRIFIRNLNPVELDEPLEEIGLKGLFDEHGRISAKEYSRLFRTLYTASYLNRANSQYILRSLQSTDFNGFLSKGVPSNIPFPHKYGINDTERVFTDSGIVYIPYRPYLLTVLIHRTSDSLDNDQEIAAAIMQQISEITYKYISTYK